MNLKERIGHAKEVFARAERRIVDERGDARYMQITSEVLAELETLGTALLVYEEVKKKADELIRDGKIKPHNFYSDDQVAVAQALYDSFKRGRFLGDQLVSPTDSQTVDPSTPLPNMAGLEILAAKMTGIDQQRVSAYEMENAKRVCRCALDFLEKGLV